MASDQIRYDLLTQQALRNMVRDLLIDVGKKGLPGEHHFFITFDTLAEGVKLSQRMRAQYPEEMTIVLQHQFWDLTITDERFEVGLSFNGIPERLTIPFTAIKGFFDPSVQFGLQFETVTEAAEGEPDSANAKPEAVSRPEGEKPALKSVEQKNEPAAPVMLKTVSTVDDDPDKPKGGGEVVRLDRFRKK